MRNDSKRAQAAHLEGYNRRSRTIRRFQTGALKMEEKMSPNDVKKNGGKIEEYMVIISWQIILIEVDHD